MLEQQTFIDNHRISSSVSLHRPSIAVPQSREPLRDIRQLRGGLISDYVTPKTRSSIATKLSQPELSLSSSQPPASSVKQFSPKAIDVITGPSNSAIGPNKLLIEPRLPIQQRSTVLKRQFVEPPSQNNTLKSRPRHSRLQKVLAGMAVFMFALGLVVSLQTLQTNHKTATQITALVKQANDEANGSQNNTFPSTIKPSSQAVSQYQVAPDLARYIKIPSLNVNARVLQVGITASGAVGTPDNVYDTAWYTGSAKPGQPGATLIDGHISSWTTHGVFYSLKQLATGDSIQIVLGNGTVLNYQVVRSQIYNTNNVDMQAALKPVTAGKSGLNLISCTGRVEKGTNEFNERVIVFAQQI
jgi:LPXTG-site transpeptidase (sortase) family protein